ncbi:MAG TPA: hypothetical protein VN778_00720, partial [Verrucomicrobiae bacterium]|nr:hypothetical protein [Verrucomicrobiae bacterium]
TLPNGKTYIFYHVLTSPRDHQSQDRLLYRSEYNANSQNKLYVPDGVSKPGATSDDKRVYYYDKRTGRYIPAAQRVSQRTQSGGASSATGTQKSEKQYLQISVPTIGHDGRP